MANYYANSLNAQKLFQVYDTTLPRVKQYLQSEIDFVKKHLNKEQKVLELGAGYGRIVRELAPWCDSIIGVDISEENVTLAKTYLKEMTNADIKVMDVHHLDFSASFDVLLCLQNGLSAMRLDDADIQKIFTYVTPGGSAFFSSYSENFWDVRLNWFREQAEKKLLGEIDEEATKNGVIVCKDGFRAVTHSPEDFRRIGEKLGYPYEIQEVDHSSLFLIIHKK